MNEAPEEPISDGELLRRFTQNRDEAAFRQILNRYQDLVMGTTMRILRNEQDAQDAFQATFLVLSRKASGMKQTGSLGNWLHLVAQRIAVAAKKQSIAKRKNEEVAMQDALTLNPHVTEENHVWKEIESHLDTEIARLPAKIREPVVLFYLKGMGQTEIAKALNCPSGSVWSRVQHGLELLQQRLSRKGVVLTGALLATVLAENAGAAHAVPAALTTQTLNAACLYAAHQGVAGALSASSLSLAEGALKTMLLKKLLIIGTTAVFAAGGVAITTLVANDAGSGIVTKRLLVTHDQDSSEKPPATKNLKGVSNAGDLSLGEITATDGKSVTTKHGTFTIVPESKIVLGGQGAEASALKVGMKVTIQFDPATKKIISLKGT